MTTSPNKPKHGWQFGLAAFLFIIAIVASGIGLWVVESQGIATLIAIFMAIVLPSCSVTAAMYTHGYTRTFFVGMGLVQVCFLFSTMILMIHFMPVDSESLLEYDDLIGDVLWDLPTTAKWHRRTLIVFLLSGVSGLLSVGLQCLIQNVGRHNSTNGS